MQVAEKLSFERYHASPRFAAKIPRQGAGLFTASPERVLTAPGASPSRWFVPSWMHPDAGHATLTYHGDRKRWQPGDEKGCLLASVAKGQEFVLNTIRQDLLAEWLAGIFAGVQPGPAWE